MGLVFALDKNSAHPPLELLFTVDEETGLVGATELKSGFIDGKILLNLDSEDEGIFTVGCAGGKHTFVDLQLKYTDAPKKYNPCSIKAGGMKGGHSGVDIKEERANAIIILTRVLSLIEDDIRIVYINGGTAHNAIPRDAEAVIFVSEDREKAVKKVVKDFEKTVKIEFANTEPDLKLNLSSFKDIKDDRAMTTETTKKVIDLILAMPHGVIGMSTDIEGLVETSNNLANVKVEDGMLKVLSSQRSSVMSKLFEISGKIESIAKLAGAVYETSKGYPAWQPNMDSPLLDKCKKLYKKMNKKDSVIEIIHAGLECGIIGSKYPGMDMISFGPTIKNPHSPDEMINVETIGMVWDFFAELLKSLK
ncbi:beta-Ala-His dipeptidase [candidate division KSB1 bacterium]